MNRPNALGAQLRGAVRCALTGILVSLLAVPSFAQSAQPAAQAGQPALAYAGTIPETNSDSTNLPLIASNTGLPDLNLLAAPTEAAPDAMATSALPNLDKAMKEAVDNQGQQLTNAQPHHGVQRPGMLVLGIVGAAAMGMGAYIYALHGSGSARAILGSMFMAPGAVAAGFGFTYAFKPHNQ